MNLSFIDYPKSIGSDFYEETKDKIVLNLAKDESILAIYQIGHVKSPGISDLDLLVIFKNSEFVSSNPRALLSNKEKYIVSHNLFGVSEKNFTVMQNYSFFHNYKHLWGKKYQVGSSLKSKDQEQLKKQIALEYLLQMFCVFNVQMQYKIINVRGLLLHVNALKYDLEFLKCDSGEILELVNEIINWRSHWFENPISEIKINDWCLSFNEELKDSLTFFISSNKIYFPSDEKIYLSKHISIERGEKLEFKRDGLHFPSSLSFLGKRYFNFQHRFNSFYFFAPYSISKEGSLIEERFTAIKKMITYNKKYLPNYMTLSSSLNLVKTND